MRRLEEEETGVAFIAVDLHWILRFPGGVEQGVCRPHGLKLDLSPDPNLPEDTKLWAVLQNASGGVWGGCVYDAEAIAKALLEK